MAGTARICALCNWVDPKARPQSTLYSTGKASAKSGESRASSANVCVTCGNRVDPGITQCPYCGNLVGSDYGQYGAAEPASSYSPPPEPPQRESVVVFQQSIGTHDKKRTYACPRCGSRIDNPRSGHCPSCGYVGSMQYDILQRQPQWAMPPQNNTPPPRYTPPASQGYSSGPATVTSVPSSPRGRQSAQPPAYIPEQANTRPERPTESTCPKCGSPNTGESRFCGNCGHRYGIGKLTQKITTMSIEDRSYAAVGSGSVMTAPIYDAASAGEGAYETEEVPVRRGRKGQRGKGEAKIRTRERSGERKFPMGLMMSVMVVAALIIALAIYVISGGTSKPPEIPTGTGPVLSGVSFTPNADGSIQVRWKTDIASTSQVMFCDPAGLCSWTDKDNSFTREHTVTMTGVKTGVLYHVTVESVDQEGNTGQFESEQTFTGAKGTGSGDTAPPKISAISTTDVTDLGFVVKWTTDEPSTSQVEYGTTKSYGSFTTIDSKLKTSHTVTIYGVSPNTSYYVRVVAADSDSNTVKVEAPNPVLTQNAFAEGVQVGNRALDFEINDLSGNLVKLSSYRGKKIVILNFWATWCTPCMDELPLFQQAKTNWSGSDRLEILAVDNVKNDSLNTIQTAINNGGYTFRVLLDSNGQVSAKYVVGNTIPITYFLDSQGIIRSVKSTNFVNLSDIETILNSLN